jgi:hypothetical protein
MNCSATARDPSFNLSDAWKMRYIHLEHGLAYTGLLEKVTNSDT